MRWFKAKLRAQFSSEVAWRCYVVFQSIFVIFACLRFDDRIIHARIFKDAGLNVRFWEMIFPNITDGYRHLGPDYWPQIIWYLTVPFIIVKTIDWVVEAREGGPSEKIRNKPPTPKLESAESKHDFGKSEERVAERGLQRQRSEKWKGPLWFCLRILVWLVAFAIGATIVRMLARGYIGG